MAKVTITIEDAKDGMVRVSPDPMFSELMRRITSRDAPSKADQVAASALLHIRNVSKKVNIGLKIPQRKLILPPN